MKTEIFKTYIDFLNREDKEINGVSPEFAKENRKYKSANKTNKGCWNCSDCSGCSRCSRCSDCSGCSDCSCCSGCSDCSGCSGCSDCSGCSRCSDCSDCSGCSRCSDLEYKRNYKAEESTTPVFSVPVIENIHQKILEVVGKPNALNMSTWHTCETTHCRAGWVVHLAGEAGYALERQTSALFAAQQIYKASSPDIQVSPPRFYESNEIAMADIKRCAELEKEQ